MWIQTHTGKRFDFLDPKPDMVCLEDIAHSLGMLARFNGHTKFFFSVAEHSINVARYVSEVYSDFNNATGRKLELAALLHDAAEAYIGDIPKPFKDQLSVIGKVEERILSVVFKKFGLDTDFYLPLPVQIKDIDRRALVTEKDLLLRENVDWGWDKGVERLKEYLPPAYLQYNKAMSPSHAKHMFMSKAHILGIKD